MVKKLTKQGENGNVLERPDKVEEAIHKAVGQDLTTLLKRAAISNPKSPDFLPSECIIHIIRRGQRENDTKTVSAFLPVLLMRCERNLRAKIPNGQLPNAELLREDILHSFCELILEDGQNAESEALDYYECRFNRAFRFFRLAAVKKEMRPVNKVLSLPETDGDISMPMVDALRNLSPTADPESNLFLQRLWQAVDGLPHDERQAVTMRYAMDYKLEDIAKHCGVTSRTIQNRLARAHAALKQLLQ